MTTTAILLRTTAQTEANQRKLRQLEAQAQTMLDEVLRRGFYGNVIVKLNIQDGTIQHIRNTVQRVER